MTVEKKTRVNVDADTKTVAVARVNKLIEAGNPATKAIASVAKELNVSESTVTNWRTAARKAKPKAPKKNHVPKTNGEAPLDIALDLLALASRARPLLGDASRKRLLIELQARLG